MDVLEWRADLVFDDERTAGDLRVFEINHPRMRARGARLSVALERCLRGAYRCVESYPERVWKGESPLVVFETIRLFSIARGAGHGRAVIRGCADEFAAQRGAGAVVLKAVPLQYVDGGSSKWHDEMGDEIGDRPWFVDDDTEAFAKVAEVWRDLGWREIETGVEPTFLREFRP